MSWNIFSRLHAPGRGPARQHHRQRTARHTMIGFNMTLIATALSDRCVIQVVDRRITRGGIPYDDLANKALCGACADATFSLCYTGLMMTPVRTDEWLANFLGANRLLSQPLPAVLDVLATGLTTEFSGSYIYPVLSGASPSRLPVSARRGRLPPLLLIRKTIEAAFSLSPRMDSTSRLICAMTKGWDGST